MKNILFIIIISTLIFSCKDQISQKTNNNTLIHENQIISYENSAKLILEYQDFELEYNQIFQRNLQEKAAQYYENVTTNFIDEETGFLKLFSQLWDKPFKSEYEIKVLWKLKIERYFRATSFLNYLRNEVSIYTIGVNNQRNNGVSKILKTKHSSDLKLPIANVDSFNTTSESIEKIINKINEETSDQLADTVLGFSVEITLGILGIFGIYKGATIHLSIPIVISIVVGGYFFWRSHNRENEIREILKAECNKALKSSKIDYLDQLNKNTIDYYSQLQKINYETNN